MWGISCCLGWMAFLLAGVGLAVDNMESNSPRFGIPGTIATAGLLCGIVCSIRLIIGAIFRI